MQHIACNSALLAQEKLCFTPPPPKKKQKKPIFLPKVPQKVRKS